MAFRVESHAEPIPGYKLIERLGGGGFGEVWKAEAPGGLLKAIKFVFGDLKSQGDDDTDGHRALQELKALSRVKTVRHPYILSLERYDIVDGQLMIVMELADKSLWDRFRECRSAGLPGIPRRADAHMEETAEPLDLMNMDYQLQHLDIKPQNLFLVYNHVKVADFGLVKDFQGVVASMTGGVTPVYASPETFDGLVTRFCDQYSLAIVYQELLTGQRPFSGTNVHQLVMQHVQGVPNLSSLPAEDQPAIARSLSKNPDDRFPTCMEMVRALRAAGSARPAASAPIAPVEFEARTAPPAPAQETPHAAPAKTESDAVTTDMPSLQAALEAAAAAKSAAPLESAKPVAATAIPVRPEIAGEGELMPALVIGLGKLGIRVLAQFRSALEETFGTIDAVPNIRILGIDTDPETVQVPNEQKKPLLPLEQMLNARLQRAIHYLRPREGRPRLDTWFDTTLLGRLPPTKRGIAAWTARVHRQLSLDFHALAVELQACLDPENLPRQHAHRHGCAAIALYIVAGLGGGTGSGMFIDLAYVVRTTAAARHCPSDVVGLLLLPEWTGTTDPVANVNTLAALRKLNHFSTPGSSFTARFDERKPTSRTTGRRFVVTCCLCRRKSRMIPTVQWEPRATFSIASW